MVKKSYATPLVIDSDVVRGTEIGIIFRTFAEIFTRMTFSLT